MVNTYVIRVLFDSKSLKRISLFTTCVYYCRHRISYSYNSFSRHIGADFNGRFLTECCCVWTNSIAKSLRLN